VVHKYAGILSAYGMALADVVQEVQEPNGLEFSDANAQQLKERLDTLSQQCHNVAGTKYLEVRPVDEVTVRQALSAAREQGVSSVSVVLAHSYACPEHELRVGAIARELGFSHVTLSHQAMPMCRVVARGYTACAEAYLTPHVDRYLAR